ncbi:MAG TPA: Stp1/IreP family PP2C-type Ser/Thr phosphatase [Solirubrobacteraceae bacterium]|jgi:protein phosphatase
MLRVAEYEKATDTGRQRRHNEDSVFARPPLFVVADGMGGAQAGEVASRLAVAQFAEGLPDGPGPEEARLAERVTEANAAIHKVSREDAKRAGMGTTLTAAYVGADGVAIAHVGDSRAYLLRDSRLERLTDDHSLVEELVRKGQLSPEEADDHPQRSIITRALGPEPDVEVDRRTTPARDGDVFVLCSDGLTSMVSESEVAAILARASDLRGAVRALIAAANDAGGRDNITVIAFRVEEVEGGAGGAGHIEQPTTAAQPSAPRTEDVRAAVAEADAAEPMRAGAPPAAVEARQPRLRGSAAPPRRRGIPRWAVVVLIVGIVVAPVAIGGWVATQSVYFVGTDGQGQVTLYRGIPYDLPAGLRLYSPSYVSGVVAATIPPARRRKLLDHSLRSHDDAISLVRQLELGRVSTR